MSYNVNNTPIVTYEKFQSSDIIKTLRYIGEVNLDLDGTALVAQSRFNEQLLFFKYKKEIVSLYIGKSTSGTIFVFIDGHTAVEFFEDECYVSKAVMEANPIYKEIIEKVIFRNINHNYSYYYRKLFCSNPIEKETLKHRAIFINTPILWEETKKSRTRKSPTTTTSNSDQS